MGAAGMGGPPPHEAGATAAEGGPSKYPPLVEAADGTRIFGAGMPIRKNGKVVGKGDLVIR